MSDLYNQDDPFGTSRAPRREVTGSGMQEPGLSREQRAAKHQAWLESQRKEEKPKKAYQPVYSTKYAKDLCKDRGWKVIASEYQDRRGYRHDAYGGCDVVALRQDRTQVLIQAGSKGTRAEHWRRFIERRHMIPAASKFLYIEFARTGEILLEEEWEV
jgi:hypothetical protein